MLLNEDGKKEFLKSNFHPYFDINLESNIVPTQALQFVNITLSLDDIDKQYSIEDLQVFFNDEYNNVIFTSSNDENIYRYEFYHNIYFIRATPFDSTIHMHILPKKYDASNTLSDLPVLFFKDENQVIDETNFVCTEEYTRYDNQNPINLYYQEDDLSTSNGLYKFDIREQAKNFNNLQINLGYSYNDTNPTNKLKHYTGILDESDETGTPISPEEFTEWNMSLMDTNYDNNADYTNVSKMQELNDIWPTDTTPYNDGEHTVGFNNPHDINKIYHKTIKYFNDDIYIEENGQYINQSWKETI